MDFHGFPLWSHCGATVEPLCGRQGFPPEVPPSFTEHLTAPGQVLDSQTATAQVWTGLDPVGLHIGLHLEILGIHGFLDIFLNFFGIFGIFNQILKFLVKIRSESCRRLRDLQKSIVILSNGAIWTRNVSLLKNTLTP